MPKWVTVRDLLLKSYLASGWTYEQLAARSGLHPNTVARAMHPRNRNVHADTLFTLAAALGVNITVGKFSANVMSISPPRVGHTSPPSGTLKGHGRSPSYPSLW